MRHSVAASAVKQPGTDPNDDDRVVILAEVEVEET
jgi:hypothetical protein